MNHSIHSADRATHLKIVAVALVAGIAVAAFGIAARTNVDYSQTAHVVKAGKPVVVDELRTARSSAKPILRRLHENGRLRAAFLRFERILTFENAWRERRGSNPRPPA